MWRLKADAYPLIAGAEARTVRLNQGRRYELRATAPVLVHPGQGTPKESSDLRTEGPGDFPVVFVAEVGSLSLICATAADAVVYLREEAESDVRRR